MHSSHAGAVRIRWLSVYKNATFNTRTLKPMFISLSSLFLLNHLVSFEKKKYFKNYLEVYDNLNFFNTH